MTDKVYGTDRKMSAQEFVEKHLEGDSMPLIHPRMPEIVEKFRQGWRFRFVSSRTWSGFVLFPPEDT